MKIFISWSGEAAEKCAELLHEKLPYFNNNIEPFRSSGDVNKGARGLQKIAEELEGSAFGIVCVTRANRDKPWINFEAGALSRQVREGKVVPFLLGATVSDLVDRPLLQFQAVRADDELQVYEMIREINAQCERATSEARLARLFKDHWPEMSEVLDGIVEQAAKSGEEPAVTTGRGRTDEILESLLPLIREQVDRITDLERAVTALRRRRVPFEGIHDEYDSVAAARAAAAAAERALSASNDEE
ncbi:TIR domain-containing protein [Streptomyces sp. NPDC093970]|uniref:TIR domain-containing protein n=1 Tax=Streptomyces sp. NPDC093970 TaxID=3155076 RepID=UPI003423959E